MHPSAEDKIVEELVERRCLTDTEEDCRQSFGDVSSEHVHESQDAHSVYRRLEIIRVQVGPWGLRSQVHEGRGEPKVAPVAGDNAPPRSRVVWVLCPSP